MFSALYVFVRPSVCRHVVCTRVSTIPTFSCRHILCTARLQTALFRRYLEEQQMERWKWQLVLRVCDEMLRFSATVIFSAAVCSKWQVSSFCLLFYVLHSAFSVKFSNLCAELARGANIIICIDIRTGHSGIDRKMDVETKRQLWFIYTRTGLYIVNMEEVWSRHTKENSFASAFHRPSVISSVCHGTVTAVRCCVCVYHGFMEFRFWNDGLCNATRSSAYQTRNKQRSLKIRICIFLFSILQCTFRVNGSGGQRFLRLCIYLSALFHAVAVQRVPQTSHRAQPFLLSNSIIVEKRTPLRNHSTMTQNFTADHRQYSMWMNRCC